MCPENEKSGGPRPRTRLWTTIVSTDFAFSSLETGPRGLLDLPWLAPRHLDKYSFFINSVQFKFGQVLWLGLSLFQSIRSENKIIRLFYISEHTCFFVNMSELFWSNFRQIWRIRILQDERKLYEMLAWTLVTQRSALFPSSLSTVTKSQILHIILWPVFAFLLK